MHVHHFGNKMARYNLMVSKFKKFSRGCTLLCAYTNGSLNSSHMLGDDTIYAIMQALPQQMRVISSVGASPPSINKG